MKFVYYASLLVTFCMSMVLAGCGAGGTSPETESTFDKSAHCINCHKAPEARKTPGTDNNVVTEWLLSTHNTSNGAGCSDCHDDGYLHTTYPADCSKCHTISGQSKDPTYNPDRDGKCAKCHTLNNPRGFKTLTYSDPIKPFPAGSTTAYTHFSTGRHGVYVATNYKQNCRKCHNPHNTSSGKAQRKDWAQSGHGSTTTPFRTGTTDFKGRGSRISADQNYGPYCVRCHTSTGYVNYVTSGYADVYALPDIDGTRSNYPEYIFPRTPPFPYNYVDKSRETINCNVCHNDDRVSKHTGDVSAYSGNMRVVASPAVWFLYSGHAAGGPLVRARMQIKFDDLGASNNCVLCHGGREAGDIIKVADRQGLFSYTTPPSGITPHDFTAGANLQGKSGFHFYTSKLMYASNPSHKTRSAEISRNGACVGCHMNNANSHLFEPVEWKNGNVFESISNIRNPGLCNTSLCHASLPLDTNYMNQQRDRYRAAVALLRLALRPVLDLGTKNDWNKFPYNTGTVPGSGPGPGYYGPDAINAGAYTMGANFVYNLYVQDPAGYTHNATYTKQLLYDSFDWLADGKMNFNGTSAKEVFDFITALDNVAFPLRYNSSTTSPGYGQGGVLNGTPFTKQQAFEFLCRNFNAASGRCERW